VRQLIETVVVTPLPERGRFALTVKGKIAALVSQDGDCTTVVGAGACSNQNLRLLTTYRPVLEQLASDEHSTLFRAAA